jgi:uncharacterized protein
MIRRQRGHENVAMSAAADAAYRRLREAIAQQGSMVIAYSGGVDSGLLAYVARDVLGDRALAVLAVSPSLAQREERAALAFLATHAIPHERIQTDEMGQSGYVQNAPDRCYFCKKELFTQLHAIARARGFDAVAYGANVDDLGDHRPGQTAAARLRVIAPLIDAGATKPLVREIARGLGLLLWDKPAAPCLASRIPYFERVTEAKLRQIEHAEDVIKDLGFAVCRVRHFGETARVEVPLEDHARLAPVWDAVVAGVKRAGFGDVVLSPDGFRSGRLNDALGAPVGQEGVDSDARSGQDR